MVPVYRCGGDLLGFVSRRAINLLEQAVFGWGGDSFEVKVDFRWGSMLGSLLFL